MNRQQLRREIQTKRKQLSSSEIQSYAYAIARQFSTNQLFLRSQHIAFYLATRGEVDPAPLLLRAWQMQKHCYLPKLHPLKPNHLEFIHYEPGDKLIPNRYGILEPAKTPKHNLKPWRLDIVFTPLVAFDNQGNRLGMGGGYYDRTFSYLHHHIYLQKPVLIGLAYEFQQVATLETGCWDVPLNYVVTEKQTYKFNSLLLTNSS